MGVFIPLFLAVSAQALPPATAVPPPETDTAAVLTPINAAFAAFEAGDASAMLRQVYPEGRVTATGNTGQRQRSTATVLGSVRGAPEAG